MALKVEGKAVCSYCRGDIAAAAEKAGLNSTDKRSDYRKNSILEAWYAVFEELE